MTALFVVLAAVFFISGQLARGEPNAFGVFAWCSLAACAFLALAGLSVLGGS